MPGADALETKVAGGSTGRLWVGDTTVTLPEDATDLTEFTSPSSPGDLLDAGWTDMGYVSDDGLTFTNDPGKENVFAWNADRAIRTLQGEPVTTLACNLLQWNTATWEFAIGGEVTADGVFRPSSDDVYRSVIVKFEDQTYVYAIVMPRGTISGSNELALSRTALAELAVEFNATPEPQDDPTALAGLPFYLITDDPAFEAAAS
jgi:hypothetical protein